MQIQFRCPTFGCGAVIGVRSALAGKQARCPACGQIVPVPLSAETGAAEGDTVRSAGRSLMDTVDSQILAVHELRRVEQVRGSAGAPILSLAAMAGFAVLLFVKGIGSGVVGMVVTPVMGLAAGAVAVVAGSRERLMSRGVGLMLAGWVMLECALMTLMDDRAWEGSLDRLFAILVTVSMSWLGAAVSATAGAAAAACRGRWTLAVRAGLGVGAGWLLIQFLVWLLFWLLQADGLASLVDGSVLSLIVEALLAVLTALLALAAVQAGRRRPSPRIARLVRDGLQAVGWALCGLVVAGTISGPNSLEVGAVVGRVVSGGLVMVSIYLAAFGFRDLLLTPL